MPLIHSTITPVKLSATKLKLSKHDSEFIAVNNGTLVNVLKQLASLVTRAGSIFSEVADLTEQVSKRVRSVKLRLDELEAKAELFDPKLVPVPEGHLDDIIHRNSLENCLDCKFFVHQSRPKVIVQLYERAGKHQYSFPPRCLMPTLPSKKLHDTEERNKIDVNKVRPASVAALRDWKLDDYLDENLKAVDKKPHNSEELIRALSKPFPSKLVEVDVTGRGFDRQKANRRSLIIYTKKIRSKKRRNTICGSIPNKECGIQTSFSSVAQTADHINYGIDSGHWSSCTSSAAQDGLGPSSSSAPSPMDHISLSLSPDFLLDDEERSLTPQLENFMDGLISDSDSVDTEGYFTSFRNECGFPKSKKSPKGKHDQLPTTIENEYELFGKGSTSTTASSCGTVVLRNKPEPPARAALPDPSSDKNTMAHSQSDDAGWEERVKRKSFIELVPSMVVVTPSPSCSSGSPPPLKHPCGLFESNDYERRNASKSVLGLDDSEYGTLSDTDSERRREDKEKPSDDTLSSRPSSTTNSTASSSNSTLTLTSCSAVTNLLPQPDVIPESQQLQIIRTLSIPKLDVSREYCSLDTVLLGSSEEEHHDNNSSSSSTASETKMNPCPPNPSPLTSGKVRGARVVLDANGEIVFSSETLRRKRRQKISFDPGNAVKPQDYEASNYSRVRESVYDKIKQGPNEKLYECIEEIRRHNLKASDAMLLDGNRYGPGTRAFGATNNVNQPLNTCGSPRSSTTTTKEDLSSTKVRRGSNSSNNSGVGKYNILLETDLDSAIPPEMPALKNLSKIKDRLKRNESYRIATDESPPRTTLSTANTTFSLQALHNNNKNKGKSNSNNKINAKRDIPEEDPVFIQQILNMSTTTNNNSNSSLLRSPTNESFNRSPLSKFALSMDDRPSFLRRESPPTMDEIAKEIYRFRKKFNIQPNASSSNSLSSTLQRPSSSLSNSSKQKPSPVTPTPTASTATTNKPTNNINTTAPLSKQKWPPEPLYSSTPIKPQNKPTSQYQSLQRQQKPQFKSPEPQKQSSGNNSSQTIQNKNFVRNFSPLRFSMRETKTKTADSSEYFGNSFRGVGGGGGLGWTNSSSATAPRSNARTSLGDFKKLLLATRRQRSSISAVEVLKPKVGMETTV